MRQQKRIQDRQGLLLNEQSLQILVETIPALVWRAKPNGHIDYVNKRLLEYFGSPLEEIIGWGWMQKAHPDDVAFKVPKLAQEPGSHGFARRELSISRCGRSIQMVQRAW